MTHHPTPLGVDMCNPQIGWQVLDRDGNVVDSGPIVHAEMAAQIAEMFGLNQKEQ